VHMQGRIKASEGPGVVLTVAEAAAHNTDKSYLFTLMANCH